MKFLFIYLSLLFHIIVANAQPAPCIDSCATLSLQEYKKGMLFYFPPNPIKEASNIELPNFKQFKACAPKTKVDTVLYRHLANRTLRLDSVNPYPTPKTKPLTFVTYELWLIDTSCNALYIYSSIVDLRMLGDKPNKAGVYTIPDAIYMNDVEWAIRNLKNKTMYSIFPVKGKRFTPVKITYIEASTSETPLKLHFETTDLKDSTIDVVLCGTNVRQSFASTFHFSRFFRCDNPQGSIKNDIWILIQQGKVTLDMIRGEVEMSLGKPQKITETTSKGGNSAEYTYPARKVYFENDKVVKVESTL